MESRRLQIMPSRHTMIPLDSTAVDGTQASRQSTVAKVRNQGRFSLALWLLEGD